MKGYTNCSSSSSTQFNEGILDVTWTIGATCSITNGFITLTAPNTSGNYRFSIPDGTWKISSSNGIHTSVKMCTVSRGQTISVTIPDPSIYTIWDGYNLTDTPLPYDGGNAGGFLALKGTVNTQTDLLTWNTEEQGSYVVHYYEANNDYGGIRTANKISFDGYSKLHIDIPYLDSWQSASAYYASVVISTTAYTTTGSSGYITSYQFMQSIDSRAGESSIHISGGSYNLELNVSNYNDDYYIYILVARGDSVPIDGQFYLTKMWLSET